MPSKPSAKKQASATQLPYSPRALRAPGSERTFTGEHLAEIAFPLGGIGTGCVSLGGRGELRDWEIFNRPGKGQNLRAFVVVWAKAAGEKPVCKVAQRGPLPPYSGHSGLPAVCGNGLPPFREAAFRGAYPIANVELQDGAFPLAVSVTGFNPFIPLNPEDSSLPVAILKYTLTNTGRKPVQATVCATLPNVIGTDGIEFRGPNMGGCVSEYVESDGWAGIRMSSTRVEESDDRFGTLALVVLGKRFTHTCAWRKEAWWDDYHRFWDDIAADGKLDAYDPKEPSPEGVAPTSSLGATVTVKPGETVTVPVLIAWHFPRRTNIWNKQMWNHLDDIRALQLTNQYVTRFADAWAVAEYVVENLDRLEAETRLFADALHGSTLPGVVIESASSQMAIVKSNTCLWLDNGNFHAFEGCSPTVGCCPMDCTHVWNYEQTLAHLFPSLERTMRRTDYLENTRENGMMAFRTLLPFGVLPGQGTRFPAADGQMGTVMKLYREWQLSGDDEFLKELWEPVKRTLDFALTDWDPNADGVMEGSQHNTYDIEYYGPNTMVGTCYLGALRAAALMAEHLGDKQAAKRYAKLLASGMKKLDAQCWGGEYYVQIVDHEKHTKYQVGKGCLTDQLLGQWIAEVAGLGKLLPQARIRKTLQSILRYNFRRDFYDHANPERIYALCDEAGTLICTWPKGGRPALPTVYADEVWTGIEYQFAGHLMYEGFVDEGLSVVKAVRDRYDGKRRNPYNEVECGDHYARAMANWSHILALSGFRYSAPARTLSFAPMLNGRRFRTFWSTGGGWGVYEQTLTSAGLKATVRVLYGSLTVEKLGASVPEGEKLRPKKVAAKAGGKALAASFESADGRVFAQMADAVTIEAGRSVTLVFS